MGNAVYRRKEAKMGPERSAERGATNSQDPPSPPLSGRPRGEAHEGRRLHESHGSSPAEKAPGSHPPKGSWAENEMEFTIETGADVTQEVARAPAGQRAEGMGPDGIPIFWAPVGDAHRSPFATGAQMAVLVSASGSSPSQRSFPIQESDGPSLESTVRSALRLLALLREHKFLLIAMATLGLAGGAASLLLLPATRKAEAEVTLRPEPKSNPVETSNQPAQSDAPLLFASAERNFIGRDAVRATLKTMGIPHPDDDRIDAVARGLTFESVGSRDFVATFSLRTRAPDDLDPVTFLSLHLKGYAESEIAKMLKVLVAQVSFLRAQTAAAEAELKRIEAEIVAFRQANAKQLADQVTLSPQNRSALEQRRLELTGEIRRLEGARGGLRRQIKRGSHLELAKVQYVQSYREALASVDRQLGEARGKGYADGHPEIKSLLAEKTNLEAMMERRLQSGLTGIDKRANVTDDALLGQEDQLGSQLAAARAEHEFIMGSLRKLSQVSGNQPELDARLADLTREQEQAKRIHAQLYERMRQSELQLALERVSAVSRFQVTSPPREKPARISGVVAMRMVIGLWVGLLVASGILFLGIARRFVSRVGGAATALVLLALLAIGCAHEAPFVWVQDVPVAEPTPVARIQPRDTLSIEIAGQPSLSGESTVRDDGSYFNPLVGSVPLVGLTPAQAGAALQARFKAVVVAPVVAVAVVRSAPIRVGVTGEVKNPGSYELTRDRRLSAALLAAGWLTDYAGDDRIFVTRMTGKHQRVRFRLRDLTTSEPHAASFLLLDGDLVFVE
jgi:protein involved in polysaccharide export with SLBB domain/uncharacterized protein involved in exopolysaccharide biosynthesis